MSLIIWFEFWLSIKMDAEGRHVHDSALGIPKRACKFIFFILVNNFASKSEISIEPSSPETTSVALNVHLLESTFVLNLRERSKLQYWRIGMATDDLVKVDTCLYFLTKGECHNS